MGRSASRIAVGLAVAVLAIQFVPVDRSNPAVEEEAPASPEARELLRRACDDCHSNRTVWPWYSGIAPISWLIARDVHEGREELNTSTWNRLDASERAEALEESWETIEDGEMPLWFYLPLHPEARLTDADRAVLREWASGGSGGRAERERGEHDDRDDG